MRLTDRRRAYMRQTGSDPRVLDALSDGTLANIGRLTPAQRRRLAKKERRAIARAKK